MVSFRILLVFLALRDFKDCFAGITLPDGESFASGSVQNETFLHVREGDTVILPCVFPTKENIKENVFDWKKDGQMEVFLYDRGAHYNNRLTGQDKQYIKRVSYFEEQLLFGNASLVLTNAMVADSGRYSCHFPHLNRYTSYVNLHVSAAPQPRTKFVDVTEGGVKLMCEVRDAVPKPIVKWEDSNGEDVPAAEPQTTSDSEGRYVITLTVTVNKPDHYRCIAKQEELGHMTYDVIYIHERMLKDTSTGMPMVAGVLGWVFFVITGVILALLVAGKCIKISNGKGSARQQCLNCAELKTSQKPLASDHSPDDSVGEP